MNCYRHVPNLTVTILTTPQLSDSYVYKNTAPILTILLTPRHVSYFIISVAHLLSAHRLFSSWNMADGKAGERTLQVCGVGGSPS